MKKLGANVAKAGLAAFCLGWLPITASLIIGEAALVVPGSVIDVLHLGGLGLAIVGGIVYAVSPEAKPEPEAAA